MYLLPKLNIPKQKTDTIAEFKGLNQRASIADNELADCYNISLENYPALSVRDGYEVYIAPTSPNEIMRAKSVRGNMLVERNGQQFQWSFIDKETGLCTAPVDLSGSDYPIGMDLYNNQLFFLSTPEFGSFDGESEEDWNFCIYSYFWDDGVMLPCNVYLISNSNIFKEYDSKIPTCFMGFGDRMLIAYKDEVAVSYRNNISDWTTYLTEGTATAECAYRRQLPDDGYFTGCANYRDYPIFFKQNSMYILYGEYTSAFDLGRIDAIGCTGGESIAICNGALYFLSKLGVMEYTGGTPKLISRDIKLNPRGYYPPYACADNRFYYISDYVYDTYTKTWSKVKLPTDSDEIRPICCYSRGGRDQIYIQTDTSTYVDIMNAPADWSFTTKQFHEYQAGKKIISRLAVGFENVSLSELKIEVSLDKGEFKTVYTWDGSTDFVKEVPVILPPCDYFQLRVSGTGKVYVHYIKRIYRVLGR